MTPIVRRVLSLHESMLETFGTLNHVWSPCYQDILAVTTLCQSGKMKGVKVSDDSSAKARNTIHEVSKKFRPQCLGCFSWNSRPVFCLLDRLPSCPLGHFPHRWWRSRFPKSNEDDEIHGHGKERVPRLRRRFGKGMGIWPNMLVNGRNEQKKRRCRNKHMHYIYIHIYIYIYIYNNYIYIYIYYAHSPNYQFWPGPCYEITMFQFDDVWFIVVQHIYFAFVMTMLLFLF